MGDKLNFALLAIYVAAAISFAAERNWPKCLYFIGAVVVTVAIALMR